MKCDRRLCPPASVQGRLSSFGGSPPVLILARLNDKGRVAGGQGRLMVLRTRPVKDELEKVD